MINVMVIILCIGILSAVFGLLLVFAPNLVLRAERKANKLYMTDAVLIKNRIPLGFVMLAASAFLGYSYANNSLKEIIFLIIAITAGVFGLLLLISPNSILIAERKANKLYMTDAFFIKHRIALGVSLMIASAFMINTYITFS
tara:strand:+ start:35 stop:463 length:429 start_codon:yes stop_codon:yes gene_type:complete